ncbi:hypothetical protein J2793_005745 [Paraburkholderia caledonica]|uniref:Uncharacterized protein n=1 Tax=Paraburkholderia caledonica TaxID=134536 RepID=A0AB73ILL1_9BURK|nr:hypothetical protein [Paraburkholderia caledonica]
MSKRGGAPAALMRGRREGCEKRLPRQCEALERSRSRTLSGASSTMKARERGETCPMRRNAPHAPKRPNAQTPKRPNAQTPKRPNAQTPKRPNAQRPQPAARKKRSTLNTPQGPLFSHRIQRGANVPVANRASERYIQARLVPRLVRSTALLFSIANYNFWTPSIGRVRVIPRVIPASVQATALSGRRVPWHRERCASV